MPARYACVFDGKGAERCDFGVKIDVHQVMLPKRLKTYPPEFDDEGTDYKKWVRRDAMVSLLSSLRGTE
ncbi:MAG: hypothetical protein ABSH50_13405 [Bryobacteraceae bacterium]